MQWHWLILALLLAYEASAQQPASRSMTPAEFSALQASEVQVEYETLEDFASGLGLTVDELDVRARAFWADATAFEYRRALGSPDVAFPYLLCRKLIGSDSNSTAVISGLDHRLAIDEAIAAASQGKDIPEESSTAIDPSHTLVNADDVYCAFARLEGSVAEAVDCSDDGGGVECIVQPLLVAMKLMPGTIQDIVDGVKQFYAEWDPVDEEEVYIPPIPSDTSMNGTASATNTSDEGGGPSPVADPKPTFPSLDLVLCPGVVEGDMVAEYTAGNSGIAPVVDIQEAATAWLLSNIGGGDEARRTLSQTFYWTSDSAAALSEQFGGEPERAALLGEALDAAKTTELCVSAFEDRLTWTGVVLPHFVRVEFMNSDADEIDEFCALALTIALATMPEVCTLEVTSTPVPFNDRAQWLIQSFEKNERPFFDAGIRGEGQIVAVSDTGIDIHNCYFSDPDAPAPGIKPNFSHRKIVQYWPFVDDSDYEYGHGTHTSGTVLGKKADGTGIADGIAPEAKVAFVDIGTKRGFLRIPPDDELLEAGRGPEMKVKAHIHSASWGSVRTNFYDRQSRSFDDLLYGWDDLLVNVAAGNSGRFNRLNTVSSPAVAKNILSVGSSQSSDDGETSGITPQQLGPEHISDFSSRGTTSDGRIKPDLTAPGDMLLSAGAQPDEPGSCDELGAPLLGSSRGGLVWMAGTSMAAPAVSGTAALVRQYFEEGYYPGGTKGSGPEFMPSAALVKAVLMNGAQMLVGVDNPSVFGGETASLPYDDAQGFGRVSLIDSLFLEDKSNVRVKVWDREVIANGGLQTFDVTVDTAGCDSSSGLRATLVWSEPGSSVGCERCLLNDLDLFIIPSADPATVYYPNGLDSRDSLNNAERVIIPDAVDGEKFTIFVEAHNLLLVSQKYSMVVTGCFSIDDAPVVFDSGGAAADGGDDESVGTMNTVDGNVDGSEPSLPTDKEITAFDVTAAEEEELDDPEPDNPSSTSTMVTCGVFLIDVVLTGFITGICSFYM